MQVLGQAKRVGAAVLIAGALITVSGGAALASHGAAGTGTITQASTAKHRAGGGGQAAVRKNQRRMVLTVTAVNGNTITANARGGATFTITVNPTTTYTRAGASVALLAIQSGSTIAVRGTIDRTAHTIQATSVTVVLPTVSGVVTAVNGQTITVTGRNAVSHTIVVSNTTHFVRAGQPAGLSDIMSGSAITAEGSTDANGTLTAMRVVIRLPRLAGSISALNGSSFTLTTHRGFVYTVTTASTTAYAERGITGVTASNLKAGQRVAVEGTLSADGKMLSALRISIQPARTAANGKGTPTQNS